MMIRFSIDDSNVVEWNVSIDSSDRLISIPNVISGLTVIGNSCNDLTELNLNRFDNMKRVEIGSNSLKNVLELNMKNMSRLESIEVGMKSLIECSSFSSMGDMNLNRVSIGDDSFGNGSVFELDEECGIEEVEIGKDCFKGKMEKEDSLGFVMNKLNDLKRIGIGSGSFRHFNRFELSGELKRLELMIRVSKTE